jgi:hypothetical protein
VCGRHQDVVVELSMQGIIALGIGDSASRYCFRGKDRAQAHRGETEVSDQQEHGRQQHEQQHSRRHLEPYTLGKNDRRMNREHTLKDLSSPLGLPTFRPALPDRRWRWRYPRSSGRWSGWCQPISPGRGRPVHNLPWLLSLDGDLLPHLLPHARSVALVLRCHVHPVSSVHPHGQTTADDLVGVLGRLVAQGYVFQIDRELASGQASKVAKEHLLVCGPGQPSHRLQRHLGIGRDTLGEPEDGFLALLSTRWEEYSDGRNVGRREQGGQDEGDCAPDKDDRHPPRGLIGVEEHAWSDHGDSKAEDDNGDDPHHSNRDGPDDTSLVDIEKVQRGRYHYDSVSKCLAGHGGSLGHTAVQHARCSGLFYHVR